MLMRPSMSMPRSSRARRTDRPQRDVDAAMGLKGRNDPNLSGPFGDIGPAQDEMQENPALIGGD